MGTPKGSIPWNKGKCNGWTDKRGYRWLYVDENGRRRARREHRVIMERAIGRRLEPWELVHHKDGNPSNNAIENLEVMTFDAHTASHHFGTRRDAYARKSMEAYGLLREELRSERGIKADMLEALQALVSRIEYYSSLRSDERPNIEDWEYTEGSGDMAKARAAIAKATT